MITGRINGERLRVAELNGRQGIETFLQVADRGRLVKVAELNGRQGIETTHRGVEAKERRQANDVQSQS